MKKTNRRILSLLLVFALLLPMGLNALAADEEPFTDVPKSFWGYDAIQRCYEEGIVNGIGNGLFAPDSTLTFAQFYVIIGRAIFKVEDGENWYAAQTSLLRDNGFLDYPTTEHPVRDFSDEGLFKGISRYEMALLMYNVARRTVGANANIGEVPADEAALPEWYDAPVRWCYDNGLLKGYDDHAFHGDDTVTRAQACTVVCRLLDYMITNISTDDDPQPTTPPEPATNLTPEEITAAIYAFRDIYPEGMPWTNDIDYVTTDYYSNVMYSGSGCVAFALIISDSIFGSAPVIGGINGQYFDFDSIKVGDIIRMNGDSHSAIVAEKYDDHIVIAEANYNRSVHWGRIIYERDNRFDYGETRY